MLLGIVAALALLLAAAGWLRAGRLARKLEALNQSYWELRYDFTRLRSQVARIDPETEQAEPPAQPAETPVAYVSLSSMRKKKNG